LGEKGKREKGEKVKQMTTIFLTIPG
jgi:hypothetical protein